MRRSERNSEVFKVELMMFLLLKKTCFSILINYCPPSPPTTPAPAPSSSTASASSTSGASASTSVVSGSGVPAQQGVSVASGGPDKRDTQRCRAFNGQQLDSVVPQYSYAASSDGVHGYLISAGWGY